MENGSLVHEAVNTLFQIIVSDRVFSQSTHPTCISLKVMSRQKFNYERNTNTMDPNRTAVCYYSRSHRTGQTALEDNDSYMKP